MIKEGFLKECKLLFPFYGLKERRYMKDFEKHLDEYLALFPNATQSDLQKEFGSPQQIVHHYLESLDTDFLIKKMSFKKDLKIVGLVIFCCIIGFFSYRAYIIHQSYIASQNTIYIDEN